MSNYPPGVTGNEYAIAGPRSEVDDTQEVSPCEQFEAGGMRVVQVTRYGNYDAGTFKRSPRIVRRAKGIPCTFEGGEVEGITEDWIWFSWDCPVCGHTNSMELEEPEPPERDYNPWDD